MSGELPAHRNFHKFPLKCSVIIQKELQFGKSHDIITTAIPFAESMKIRRIFL